MIAAAVAMFTACQNTDSFKEARNEANNSDAISFSAFSTKQTRAENSNALYTWIFVNNHADFQVWSFKDIAPSANDAVFDGTKVTVTGDGSLADTKYTYSPLRFWDKTAGKYHFYAAAPAFANDDAEKWEFVDDNIAENAIDAGYFKTTSTLTGVNLKNLSTTEGPSTSLTNYFKGKEYVDKMIAAPCDFVKSRYAKTNPDAVQLNFNHILSKLNVTVRKGANISDAAYTVVLKSFAIKNMIGKGDFTETPDNKLAQGITTRWDKSSYSANKVQYSAITVSNAEGFTVTNDANYIVESLAIPQDIAFQRVALDGKEQAAIEHKNAVLFSDYAEYCAAKPVETLDETAFNTMKAQAASDPNNAAYAEIVKEPEIQAADAIAAISENSLPYFVITYTINDDQFTAYYNLAGAFGATLEADDTATADVDESKIAFNEGWQNTLNIVINPDKIEFTADVAAWGEKEATVYVTEDETQNP